MSIFPNSVPLPSVCICSLAVSIVISTCDKYLSWCCIAQYIFFAGCKDSMGLLQLILNPSASLVVKDLTSVCLGCPVSSACQLLESSGVITVVAFGGR